MNSTRIQEKISKKGSRDQLYQVSFFPKKILEEWKIKKRGITNDILPKISKRKADINEPKKPRKFLFSEILESYLKKLLSKLLCVTNDKKTKNPVIKSKNITKNFSKFALKFLNIE